MDDNVSKARNGDESAFYALIHQYREKLYKTAFYYLQDETLALEAIQEVTCRAYLKIRTLKEPSYFSTWLVRITINYCLDELKRSKRIVPLEVWQEPEAEAQDTETKIELALCIKRLKPKYRDVIVLKYYEDMSVEEIARALNKPLGTVKTWIKRGLEQLRGMMKGSELYVQ